MIAAQQQAGGRRFGPYVWGVLGYNLLVILWGAYVRATGSGAGCGSHWPLCNGAVIPQAAALETQIEFTHRVMSGLTLLLVLGMVWYAFRRYPKGHPVRLGAGLSGLFTLTEALVGAGLVLFELTGGDTSAARAFSITIHQVNTLLLLAAITLTAWWASGGAPVRLRGQGRVLGWIAAAWVGMFILAASGAITALGDTLFPAASLAEGLAQDRDEAAHFLIRLRVYHPLIAVVMAVVLNLVVGQVRAARPSPLIRKLSYGLIALFLVQLALGAFNVLLLAPVWMQMVHLLVTDTIWIVLVLVSAASLAVRREAAAAREPHLTADPVRG